MADLTIRHGDGAHFMRPDRVYRTSVISPMFGYQPQADVQHVAMMFTQGPQRAMQLQGLGAMPGPVQRFLSRLQAWIAEKQAKKLMQVPASQGTPPPFVPPGHVSQPPPFVPPGHLPQPATPSFVPPGQLAQMPGTRAAMAQQISPHLATQMQGVLQIAQLRYGQGYPGMAALALTQRPIGEWYR